MMQKQIMSLTSSAAVRVKHLLAEKDGAGAPLGLKIGIKNAGCSGMSYTMDYATEVGRFDEVVEDQGVKLVIDAKAVMFLIGTELDFQESKLGANFVFKNPNVKSTCGCGESFSTTQ